MVPFPIRSRIPEHCDKLGKDQQWLANKAKISKSQLSDYVNLRYILGLAKAKQIARLLKLKRIDDLYDWEWREE